MIQEMILLLNRQNSFSLENKKKQAVTMLELLLVIILLGIVFSMAGGVMYSGIAQERFHSDTQKIINKMLLARNLAIQWDTEVTFTLFYENDCLFCKLNVNDLKNSHIVRSEKLKHIASFGNPSSLNVLEVVFSRMGSANPIRFALYSTVSFLSKSSCAEISSYPYPHFVDLKEEKNTLQSTEISLFPYEIKS